MCVCMRVCVCACVCACVCVQVGMTTAIVHLMQGDVDGLVDDAISLGFLPTSVDRTG